MSRYVTPLACGSLIGHGAPGMEIYHIFSIQSVPTFLTVQSSPPHNSPPWGFTGNIPTPRHPHLFLFPHIIHNIFSIFVNAERYRPNRPGEQWQLACCDESTCTFTKNPFTQPEPSSPTFTHIPHFPDGWDGLDGALGETTSVFEIILALQSEPHGTARMHCFSDGWDGFSRIHR